MTSKSKEATHFKRLNKASSSSRGSLTNSMRSRESNKVSGTVVVLQSAVPKCIGVNEKKAASAANDAIKKLQTLVGSLNRVIDGFVARLNPNKIQFGIKGDLDFPEKYSLYFEIVDRVKGEISFQDAWTVENINYATLDKADLINHIWVKVKAVLYNRLPGLNKII